MEKHIEGVKIWAVQKAKKLVDNIRDDFEGIDRNPEHIARFPNHSASCSKTQPLVIREQLQAVGGLYDGTFVPIAWTITCSECHGTQSINRRQPIKNQNKKI